MQRGWGLGETWVVDGEGVEVTAVGHERLGDLLAVDQAEVRHMQRPVEGFDAFLEAAGVEGGGEGRATGQEGREDVAARGGGR
ncbi:hypothetical protein D3C85_1748520 [compost metagenome]